ncbi:MAG: hypothetical protein EHM20_00200 [Alphaproteobacteria bacterium]|nr:MAG: hypothetical protein EHM20_00200 [Alphaproteobacteria bacterium]
MNNTYKEMEIKIDIWKEIYSKDDYTVYVGELAGQEITINCNGFFLRPGVTTLVGVMGSYRGKQSFKASYEKFDTESYDSKLNLLCSIKGIKDNTAKKVLDGIPNHDLKIFYSKNCPKIKGVGPATIEKIFEGLNFLKNNEILRQVISLAGQSISNKKIHKLVGFLTEKNITVDQFKADPYETLIEDLEMNFKKVDFLAQEKFKCPKNLRSRILYLTEQITNKITGFGSTYVQLDTFINEISGYNLGIENVNDFINCDDAKVINENGKIQTKLMNEAEKNIPTYLKLISNLDKISEYEKRNIDILLREYEQKNKIRLHDKQKEAIISGVTDNVIMICGGAGTGKTTIIKAIIYILEKLNYKMTCIAPTGKAARRMSEATNHTAITCHRYYYSEESGQDESFQKGPHCMIIDEFSMVDTTLFYKVLKAMDNSVTSYVKLILVGDPGQLPSVGAGAVQSDLIESGKINVITLTNTFRQSGDSNILNVANLVRENKSFDMIKTKDFFSTLQKNPTDYILKCWAAKTKEIDLTNKGSLDTLYNEFQICTSSRRRCNEINKEISDKNKNTRIFIGTKETNFCLNDKVMNTKNDYMNDVYNGEFGRIDCIEYIDRYEMLQRVRTNEALEFLNKSSDKKKDIQIVIYYFGLERHVRYDLNWDELENLQLAYCCTIHKLQGSEFQTVVCDLSEFNMITDSRLLYTAVTRAKKMFVLISNTKDTIDKIVRNKLSSKRKTLLVEKMEVAHEI